MFKCKFTGQIQAESVNFNQSSVKSARLSIARRFCAGDNTSKQSPTRKSKNKKCLLKCNEAANEYLSDKKTINVGQIAKQANKQTSKPANQQTSKKQHNLFVRLRFKFGWFWLIFQCDYFKFSLFWCEIYFTCLKLS